MRWRSASRAMASSWATCLALRRRGRPCLFDRNDVDLVILNRAPPVLAHRIAQLGSVVCEAKHGIRANLEVASRHRHVDTEPLRRN